jgi:DNA-binding response OmpR family regulator
MPHTLKTPRPPIPAVPLGTLPSHLRLLFITGSHRTGAWLTEAFAHDSAVHTSIEEALGMANGLARLRDEAFDAVLATHEPGQLDGLDLAEALRGGGSEEPLILLGAQSEQEVLPLAFEAGADAYICVNTTTTRSLIWITARAIERHRLIRENRRLAQTEQHRLQQEHHETQRMLDDQRSLIRDLEAVVETSEAAGPIDRRRTAAQTNAPDDAPRPLDLPEQLVLLYRELMRAYVIMGAGNLGDDMSRMAELMADAEITAPETMQLHVNVLEEMVKGLGTRSARHVMTRADLLVLEVMVHLSEVYRKRYFRRRDPSIQLALPGFDDVAHRMPAWTPLVP